MQTLTKVLIDTGLSNRVVNEGQLARVLGGTPQRRYHLVNRAMAAGDLLRLRRGKYLLAQRYRNYPAHPFALAQSFDAGSYVSFETALSHHGWIPEGVHTIASVTPGRKSSAYEHADFGSFSFHPVATVPGYFLSLVERLELSGQAAFVAQPARALMDLVYMRKQEWQGMAWLTDSLRIDPEQIQSISSAQIRTLSLIYRNRRVRSFLTGLSRALAARRT
jgi:predicted transcriptional regulator of viral defense system